MPLSTKTINRIRVKCPQFGGKKEKPFKGKDMFSNGYSNISMIASTKSGKTVCILNILKQCIDRRTTVYLFCPTHSLDKTYKLIKQWLKSKRITYKVYDHFIDDETGDNHIDDILHEIEQANYDTDEETAEVVQNHTPESIQDKINREFDEILGIQRKYQTIEPPQEKRRKKHKKKYKTRVPKYLFIFDDLAEDMRHKAISKLFKKSRHYEAMCISSTQWLNDYKPASLRQLSYLLLFRGQSSKKLEEIWKKMRPPIDLERFKEIYYLATKRKYSFMYYDVFENQFRRNFDTLVLPSVQS